MMWIPGGLEIRTYGVKFLISVQGVEVSELDVQHHFHLPGDQFIRRVLVLRLAGAFVSA